MNNAIYEHKNTSMFRNVSILPEQLYRKPANIENRVQMPTDLGLHRKMHNRYEKQNVIFDNVEAGIIEVSPQGIITFANRCMAEMFKMDISELIGSRYSDHLHVSEKIAGIESMRQIVVGAVKSVELDRHYIRKDGTDFWGHLIGTRFDNTDGSMSDQIIVISDITKRRQTEKENKLLEQQLQQAQKMESLGVLAGGIAHDFNNILSIIIGSCNLAKLDSGTAGTYISTIENAAERAAGLCRQMMAYAGKAPFDMSQINIGLLVEEMVKMLKVTIPQNAAIKFDNSTDIPFITGDVNQLNQVVMNLIINASEAIGEKQGEICVLLSTVEVVPNKTEMDHFGKAISPGWYVCLEVTDNGCGMNDETMKKIFEPFYTTKITGRGLGMSSVLGIITAHKGAFRLFSKTGLGTTFKVYLPIQKGNVTSHQSNSKIFSSSTWQGSGTVLLVDDTEELKDIAKTMLEILGFNVIEASNGREALKLYQKSAADIKMVLTDIGMPIMDGYELFFELKKINPELPIIISSGYGNAAVALRIERNEIAGIVNKPYRFEQLQEVLKNVVEKRFS